MSSQQICTDPTPKQHLQSTLSHLSHCNCDQYLSHNMLHNILNNLIHEPHMSKAHDCHEHLPTLCCSSSLHTLLLLLTLLLPLLDHLHLQLLHLLHILCIPHHTTPPHHHRQSSSDQPHGAS